MNEPLRRSSMSSSRRWPLWTRSIVVVRNLEVAIDFLLATDSLPRCLFARHRPQTLTRQQNLWPRIALIVLLFSLLSPLTLAKKLPSTNKIDLPLFTNESFLLLPSSPSPRLTWHAGCCIRPNQSMCDARIFGFPSTTYASNGTSPGTFLFDGVSESVERRRLFRADDYVDGYEFMNNQTLFCQRYMAFRHLSANHLALFTYCIVIIGIIFNSFVFLVLMCGSLRRSSSFTLFLALTCFDLLSLASSLFALLFRTVMTYLKTSAPFCKMFGIFFLYFRQCSSTTLLLIAIERCVVIKYPFCRYMFNRIRLPLLASIMIIYVVPIPFDFIFYTSGTLHCEAFNTPHAHRYQIFRGFFTVFTYAMIPFAGIAISNLLIIIELKNSRKRFVTTDENGTMRRFSSNVMEKRGTTVMLFVASFAFLLLLGPFYVHWCITYLFHNNPRCDFTRNIYENVQVCMGVLHPHLTVIEKGMRESNHAVNFLLYMATSSRFRSDFKHICRRLLYCTFGSSILFLYKHICVCCSEPACLVTLERHVTDTTELDSSFENKRKNQTAYKTSHYYTNIERRRQQHQLLKANLITNNSTATATSITPATSLNAITKTTTAVGATNTKNVRNPPVPPSGGHAYGPLTRPAENKRQAARLCQHFSASGDV